MAEDDFKITNLLHEMKHLHIDIMGVSETHWTTERNEAFEKEDYVILQSGRNDNIHRQGVALILSKELANSMQGYDIIDQRFIMMQLETITGPLVIYQIYAPDTPHSAQGKEEF